MSGLRYVSVCSGIEAATVAWEPLGWQAVAYSEIEAFPSALLAHRFPSVPNLGDLNDFRNWNISAPVDVLVGGTPCQSFSVAGLRRGLADPRGNLALTFLALADALRPRWIVWENVPGVLSSGRGRDFGAFLGALGQLGYGWAYRVLDAQFYGVAQRRRRVFVVGCLGGAFDRAAEVLSLAQGLRGDTAPSRQTEQGTARGVAGRARGCGGEVETVGALCADTHPGGYSGQDAYTGRLIPSVADPITANEQRTYTHEGNTFRLHNVVQGVRRLTPRECERLQGFPDDWTLIPWRGKPAEQCPDGMRYKALGNSMAVPVVRWIGQGIERVEAGK